MHCTCIDTYYYRYNSFIQSHSCIRQVLSILHVLVLFLFVQLFPQADAKFLASTCDEKLTASNSNRSINSSKASCEDIATDELHLPIHSTSNYLPHLHMLEERSGSEDAEGDIDSNEDDVNNLLALADIASANETTLLKGVTSIADSNGQDTISNETDVVVNDAHTSEVDDLNWFFALAGGSLASSMISSGQSMVETQELLDQATRYSASQSHDEVLDERYQREEEEEDQEAAFHSLSLLDSSNEEEDKEEEEEGGEGDEEEDEDGDY